MKPSRRRFLAGAAASCAVSARAAAQAPAPDVDLLLVLLNDGSGSIDADEYRLQREGTAAALEHPQVLAAIGRLRTGAIAVAYGEWGTPGAPEAILPWTRIAGAADAADFADRLIAAPRRFQSYNAIGDALEMGIAMIGAAVLFLFHAWTGGRISRAEGGVLLALYVVYCYFLLNPTGGPIAL